LPKEKYILPPLKLVVTYPLPLPLLERGCTDEMAQTSNCGEPFHHGTVQIFLQQKFSFLKNSDGKAKCSENKESPYAHQ